MKNRQKVKRMSFSDVKMAFPEIEKKEQAFYIGRRKYIYDTSGTIINSVDDGKINTATICVRGEDGFLKEGSVSIPDSEYLALRHGNHASESSARALFDFIGQKTSVEWGLKREPNGWLVWTDKNSDGINPKVDNKTIHFTHSHHGDSAAIPSEIDRATAANAKAQGYNIKWTVFYNGIYQDYDEDEPYGDPYGYDYPHNNY